MFLPGGFRAEMCSCFFHFNTALAHNGVLYNDEWLRKSEKLPSTKIKTDSYIAVSGSYERFFEKDGVRYHHILNPENGYPAESDIESSVVISGSGALSDALSTALFVMGYDKALEFYSSGIYNLNYKCHYCKIRELCHTP